MSPYINKESNNNVVLTTAKQINLYWNTIHSSGFLTVHHSVDLNLSPT
jgi:hypothetical protein